MRVMVFEPQFVGHNLNHVMHLVTRLQELGCETHLVTSQQASESEEFASHLGHLKDSFCCHALDCFESHTTSRGVSINGPRGNWSLATGLLQGISHVKPDHLYIPFGNPVANLCGVPSPLTRALRKSSLEAELVLLFGRYSYSHTGFRSHFKERLALYALDHGPWTRIHHLLPHAIRVMKAYNRSLAKRAFLIPDPVEQPPALTRTDARRTLSLPEIGRYVSIVGLVDRRKGVLKLLEAMRVAQYLLEPTDRLLLAGKQTEEIQSILRGQYNDLVESGRVISMNRHLSNHELWAACFASNVIATPYPNHRYSASIVIRAATAGVPVLANDIGWMGEVLREYGLGIATDTNNHDAFVKAIKATFDLGAGFQLSDSAKAFVRFHSSQNFAKCLTARLEERMAAATSIIHAA
jgi:glycosyltransferase involved in cell wall biosynthesis